MSKKLISFLLTFALLISLCAGLVVTASAAEGDDAGSEDGIVVNKTAELQNDGTVKITLEAYATGHEVTHTSTVRAAADMVLVLDVSGSMDKYLSATAVTTTKNLNALDKTKGEGYYVMQGNNGIYDLSYQNNKWQYKKDNKWREVNTDWNYSIYVKSERITKMQALQNAVCAFIDSVAADAVANNVDHKISIVKFADDSYYSDVSWWDWSDTHLTVGNHRDDDGYNYTELTSNFVSVNNEANVTNLKSAVNAIVAGGATAADYGMSLAKEVLEQPDYKNDSKVKTVVMFTDGEPNHGSGFVTDVANTTISTSKTMKDSGVTVFTVGVFDSPSTDVTNYMNYVSSNYPSATSMTAHGDPAANKKFYMTASSADQLENVFMTIAHESVTGASSVTADASTKTVDILSDAFVLDVPAGTEKDHVEIYVAGVSPLSTSEDLVFLDKQKASDVTEFSQVELVLDEDGKLEEAGKFAVSGFDFAENWCGKSGSAWQGYKLIVEISDIEPTSEAFTGSAVNTNKSESGLYTMDGMEPFIEFPMPSLTLNTSAVVLDYAKKMDLTAAAGLAKAVKLMDEDKLQYGTSKIENDKVWYTLNTTSMTGDDEVYVFGTTADSANAWSKVTVKAATNIYYEDTFDGTATTMNGESLPSITYSENWTKATAGDNVAYADNSAQGWVEAFKTETGYTDGTATVATIDASKTATATINFTGTGLDVYTKTTAKSGCIIAVLQNKDDSAAKTKLLKVYNQSKSGDFYSVPTLSFSDLDYGTYTLTIMVTSDAATRAEGLFEYCIDGIRVYNPNQARTAQFITLIDTIGASDSIYVDEDGDVHLQGSTLTIDESEVAIADLAAKKEVYLQNNATVTLAVKGGSEYYIGMKSLKGDSVTAKFTNGTVGTASEATFSHTGDLYYKVTPVNDQITVMNTGDGILALTKLQVVDAADAEVTVVTGEEAVTRAVAFASLPSVPYGMEGLVKAEDELVEDSEPVIEITQPQVTPVVKPVTDAPVIDQAFILRVTNIINSFRALFARG